jgi:CHAD domain-containing protein
MAFRILADESVEEAVQRIAREQLDSAIDEINDQGLNRHVVVHQVRKRCKKIRGLVRLVRPQFEDTYDHENAWYRDAAQQLSYVRDAQSIIDTFDKIMDHFQDQIDHKAFAPVRKRLTNRRKKVAKDEAGLRERLDVFLERLHEGRERVAAWRLREKGFSAVQGGVTKTYARGCTAMTKAYQKPSTENFHEWRKRVKYHWYHMRLLQSVWQAPMQARCDAADLLSDYLGDDHDLSILRETLLDRPADFGGEATLQALLGLLTQRQVELRAQAKLLGVRLYAEKPQRFSKRLHSYWNAWRSGVETELQTTREPESITIC